MVPSKPKRWCAKCRATHDGRCPQAQPWSTGRAGRGRRCRDWDKRRVQVFERDNYLCQIHLNRGVLVPVELHGANHGVCDHVIPTAEGGSNELANLQTICRDCDREKTAAESRRGRGL
ncbi:MAG: HNH endonuclease [Gammaproteobacteria bacterium]|nr:MAG: HNH endonuclease [Gammaproteobacteria bacterium]